MSVDLSVRGRGTLGLEYYKDNVGFHSYFLWSTELDQNIIPF